MTYVIFNTFAFEKAEIFENVNRNDEWH